MEEGIVLVVGDTGREAARSIAARRGWKSAEARDGGEVQSLLERGPSGTLLVVWDADRVVQDALLSLADTAARSAPELSLGFLYGSGEEGLLAASSRLERSPRAGASGPQPAFAARGSYAGARIVEHDPKRSSALELFSTPSELCFIAGHSNGLDMGAGPVLLCRQQAHDARPDELKLFPCFRGAECTKRFAGEERAHPAMLRSKRVVIANCWGLTTSAEMFEVRHTLGTGFLENPAVEALITTVRVATIGQTTLSLLYYFCNEGLPFGLVANRANRALTMLGMAPDLLCFGDPCSRIERSTNRWEAEWEGRRFHLSLPDRDTLRDVSVPIGPIDLPPDPVIVDESNGVVSAALDPHGRSVFVTGRGSATCTIQDRSELIDRAALSAIWTDLRVVERYLRGASDPMVHDPRIEAAQDALADAIDLVEGWPIDEIPAGGIVRRDDLDAIEGALEQSLQSAASAVCEAYAGPVRRKGGLHSIGALAPYFHPGPAVIAVHRCVYCGSSADERVLESRLGHDRRSLLICRACGITAYGDLQSLGPLELRGRLTPGCEVAVELSLSNPYSIGAWGSALILFEQFDTKQTCDGVLRSTRIDPAGQRTLELELAVPKETIVGRYHLLGIAVVGARLQFLRRPVLVTPGRDAYASGDGS